MDITVESKFKLEHPKPSFEELNVVLDLSVSHLFASPSGNDLREAFDREQEAIADDVRDFVALRVVPNIFLSLHPDWIRIPSALKPLHTDFHHSWVGDWDVQSTNNGFEYSGEINVRGQFMSNRPVTEGESVYICRANLGVIVADVVTGALHNYFHGTRESTMEMRTKMSLSEAGIRNEPGRRVIQDIR